LEGETAESVHAFMIEEEENEDLLGIQELFLDFVKWIAASLDKDTEERSFEL